jgi:hypothetical protein
MLKLVEIRRNWNNFAGAGAAEAAKGQGMKNRDFCY